jgi:carbon storage regulator
MLILSRKKGEEIVIGEEIRISVVDIRGDKVRLGIECSRDIPVHRREVWEEIERERLREREKQKKESRENPSE